MARKGTITLYKGVGKTSGKPFTALKLEVGSWNTLYFPTSRFEMEHIEKYLEELPDTTETKNILEEDDTDDKGFLG